jgi:putative peptide zinc metalloprotease protein
MGTASMAASASAPAAAWPALREELTLYPGPQGNDGSPTWSLHDPVRNLYFRIDWLGFEVLARWQLGDAAAICRALAAETTLRVDEAAVQAVGQFLLQSELVMRPSRADVQALLATRQRQAQAWWSWLLHHYLFFRVPLWRPDRWLGRALPWVGWAGGRAFAFATLGALALGLASVSRQWDQFTATLLDVFSLQGLVAYGVTLVCVKFLHELGHAFTAKRLGCRVPTMGVAFLVLFPVAYTDVNDAWKLPRRGQRLAVGAAGILTELAIAAWATLAWALLPDGSLRHAAFLLATTTWVSTVLVNASPFLRFDGYFLLMDALDLPNLHQRCFALARWHLREALFAWGAPPPETFAAARRRFLLVFAWLTWLYRLIVFGGIAVLVYTMTPKPLGPVLAAIELMWFIVMPIGSELRAWARAPAGALRRGRTGLSLGLLLLAGLVVAVPWDTRVRAQGLLGPSVKATLVAPGPALLQAMLRPDGSSVAAGEAVVQLQPPDLDYQRRAIRARAEGLQWQAGAGGVEDKLRGRQGVIEAALGRVRTELDGVRKESDRYTLKAPAAGQLVWSEPDWQPGTQLARNEPVVEVVDPHSWQVHTYLPEQELQRLREGNAARFVAESGRLPPLPLRIVRIDTDATRVLADGLLASLHGGELLVREQGRQLLPEQALYRVTLRLDDAGPALLQQLAQPGMPTLRGQVVMRGAPRAWAEAHWRSVAALLRREAGF